MNNARAWIYVLLAQLESHGSGEIKSAVVSVRLN